jgi:4-hydroxy-tetrahydrodipicolinate reductase
MPIRVGLHGAGGRMGCLLSAALLDAEDLEFVAATDYPTHPFAMRDIGVVMRREPCGIPLSCLADGVQDQAQVILDFSLPQGTLDLIDACPDKALVVGTTGFDATARARLVEHSRRAPVVWSPNYSAGIAVLSRLLSIAAEVLPGFDLEIVEKHHRNKKDAPSGTALRLAQVAAEARHWSLEDHMVQGRSGDTGTRPRGEIGVHAVRGGDIVGEHEVLLAGSGEQLFLRHVATSREPFVHGALLSARWLVDREPGLYSFADVLGIG